MKYIVGKDLSVPGHALERKVDVWVKIVSDEIKKLRKQKWVTEKFMNFGNKWEKTRRIIE